ncbi:hypothetical protein PISMIDRAFT_358792 [Pisolithus microcarpus 441]|uniref:Uncharacterized protein n=1 Tax=Pisolithus microcarpus 441 TaxID=765257 RepID=A0A0C9Z2G7_9AGAM|nr:hypothetical protein PISMIDRAFT_358792 [Pisolithus microcarpus 441]
MVYYYGRCTVVESFITLVSNVYTTLLNEAQPLSPVIPWDAPFTVSQDSAANTALRRAPHSLRPLHIASKRLTVTELVDATVTLVVDVLRLTFDSARTYLDLDLDREYGALVADVEQCTRPDICSSPLPWLTKRTSSFPAWVSSSTWTWSRNRTSLYSAFAGSLYTFLISCHSIGVPITVSILPSSRRRATR